jgi:hypothetical protein
MTQSGHLSAAAACENAQTSKLTVVGNFVRDEPNFWMTNPNNLDLPSLVSIITVRAALPNPAARGDYEHEPLVRGSTAALLTGLSA